MQSQPTRIEPCLECTLGEGWTDAGAFGARVTRTGTGIVTGAYVEAMVNSQGSHQGCRQTVMSSADAVQENRLWGRIGLGSPSRGT